MKFTKMHGLQNDYVYVNGFEERVNDPPALARAISHRHTGVGSDGMILILPSQKADVRMRMFNADGSEGEMCGNGIRCLAKYVFDRGIAKSNPLKVETGRGVLNLQLQTGRDGKIEQVTVNMGEPVLELPKIPFDIEHAVRTKVPHTYRITTGPGYEVEVIPVSVGNPHAAIFVDDVSKVSLEEIGPVIEHHKSFPKRVNAHWVQVVNENEIIMRTWERGSGITLACGTGASSMCVASVLTGRTERKLLVHLPGGDLRIEWKEDDNCVYMTGPATEVFSGEWPFKS
ncbi:MAG TPA: diaminopimelate epimerase [Tepidisphaeraceae bacterium]|jgi:diaminopimelate epimerase